MLYRLTAFALLLFLAACGGGGGGDSGTPTPTVPPTLRGVAATGAPLVNAQISVVDGQGKAVGTATTHAADGSYSLTLSATGPAAPLFIQARGMDASGAMQVLHSTVPTISATMVGHVTPLTNAVVALALGAEPAPVFAAASSSSSQLTQMAGATAAAGDFLKTLLKTQLTDLKITDAKTLDLLADASFAANKGAHDLLIESVRVDLARSSANVPLLQLGNKFLAAPTAEVVVALPTAQTELVKATGATPANAITSTLKAATSATTLLGNLPALDDLGAALNQLIAQGLDVSTILTQPLVNGYDKHNGRVKSDLAAVLSTYTTANRQFGRFQLLGCADDSPAAGNCSKVIVGALISDSTGTVVDQFTDVVSYNKAATTTQQVEPRRQWQEVVRRRPSARLRRQEGGRYGRYQPGAQSRAPACRSRSRRRRPTQFPSTRPCNCSARPRSNCPVATASPSATAAGRSCACRARRAPPAWWRPAASAISPSSAPQWAGSAASTACVAPATS